MKTAPIADVSEPSAGGRVRRYFIADAHLDGRENVRAHTFRALLQRLSAEAAERTVELFILGDLFEFWAEFHPQLFDEYRADLAALEQAAAARVQLFVLFGNRDFGYGRYAQQRFSATVLGDGDDIQLNDSRHVWLEHGDLLCTADRRYLRFRRIVRSWPVRLVYRLMPWSMARKTLDRIRQRTVADKATKPASMVDIDLEAARARLESTGCDLLICGHTHRPRTEELGGGKRLIVLPPWCDGPRGYVDDEHGFRPFSLDAQ